MLGPRKAPLKIFLESISPLETPGKANVMLSHASGDRKSHGTSYLPQSVSSVGWQRDASCPAQGPRLWASTPRTQHPLHNWRQARDGFTAPALLLGPLLSLHGYSSPAAQARSYHLIHGFHICEITSCSLQYSYTQIYGKLTDLDQSVCRHFSKCPVNSNYYLAHWLIFLFHSLYQQIAMKTFHP